MWCENYTHGKQAFVIIVEGMDGSGKTSLVQQIMVNYGLPMHARASDSIAGPVDNLYEWAMSDVATLTEQPCSVYDRHPFISQFVYAPILNRDMDDRFFTEESRIAAGRLFRNAIVIFCDPGLQAVMDNVLGGVEDGSIPQYHGVEEHLVELYNAYRVMAHYWAYPSRRIMFDYHNPPDSLDHTIQAHIGNFRSHYRGQ